LRIRPRFFGLAPGIESIEAVPYRPCLVEGRSMRVLVCGGSDFNDQTIVDAVLDRLHANKPFSLLVHGTNEGTDACADHWAGSRRVPTLQIGYRSRADDLEAYGRAQIELMISFPGAPADAFEWARASNAGMIDIGADAIKEHSARGDAAG